MTPDEHEYAKQWKALQAKADAMTNKYLRAFAYWLLARFPAPKSEDEG